jgi:hypothetical protein
LRKLTNRKLTNRKLTNMAMVGVVLALSVTAAACGLPDHTDLDCKQHACHVDLESGKSVTINGQTFAVKNLSNNSVTLDSHGFSLTLGLGTEVTLGKYHLRLGQTDGGGATLEIKD